MAAGPVIGPVDARPALRGDIRLARRGPDASARSVAGGADLLLRLFRHLQPRLARLSGPHQDLTAPNRSEYRVIARLVSAQPPARRSDGVLATSFGDGAQRQDRRLPVPSGCLSRGIGFEIGGLCAVVAGSTGLVANSPVRREGAQWHQRDRLWRQLLGLESPGAFVDLDGLDQHMAAMKPYYARFRAATHLTPDDDNAAALCSFLRDPRRQGVAPGRPAMACPCIPG